MVYIPKWIPVERTAPPQNQRFLGLLSTGGIHAFEWTWDSMTFVAGAWEQCPYCGGGSHAVIKEQQAEFPEFLLITHWMSLPDLPGTTKSMKFLKEPFKSNDHLAQSLDLQ